MSKKSEGSGGSTTLITTMATTGGLLLLRKGLAAAWKKVTGRVPPTDLTDPEGDVARGTRLGRRDRDHRGDGAVLHRALDHATPGVGREREVV